ncbi:MAG: hypothetical protein L6V91_00960 [Bacilli bacterium]|nr:MAG: hypothetical protein L6V91_00960 [Bacilli bacterium]
MKKAFLEYLKLQYRRNTYAKDYIKTLISDKDVEKNIIMIMSMVISILNIFLVKVDSSASDKR